MTAKSGSQEPVTLESLRDEARHVYGADAAGYAQGRPDYPEEIYRILTNRCVVSQAERETAPLGRFARNPNGRHKRIVLQDKALLGPRPLYIPRLAGQDRAHGTIGIPV